MLDEHWTHKKHIESIITKLRKLMPSLYSLKYLLDKKTIKTIYFAWIESLLRYGIEVYGRAKDTQLEKLQKVQNKIIKIMFKKNPSMTTKDIFTKEQILNIKQLRDYITVCENYYSQNFKHITKDKAQMLRNSTYRYDVPLLKNDYGKQNRNFLVPSLFNKLPYELLNITGMTRVKKEIKLYILTNAWGGLQE